VTDAARKSCLRCLVSGRVQGVFFRATTRQQALGLGLTGYVRNLADGRVEVFACGEPEAVGRLGAWLRQGPELARVDELQCSPVPFQELDGFRVR
jgi:acylphosphatase